jgi:hypothetical protein
MGEDRVLSLLRALTEQMCAARSGADADLLTAIGGEPAPPSGVTAVHVRGGDLGQANVELDLAPNTVTRRELDACFGAGRKLPTSPAGTFTVAYDVAFAGAPSRCTVFAYFGRPPEPAVSVRSVKLRLERA